MFLEAYFDESISRSGVSAVAGYAFRSNQARKFDEAWRKMLGPVRVFHMTDLCALRREFKGFTEPQRETMIRRAVQIINTRFAVGVAASCFLHEFASLVPRNIHKDPYPLLCYLSMMQIGQKLRDNQISGNVAYFFEAGNLHHADADDLIRHLMKDSEVRQFCRYKSHTFIGKECATPLQSADLLAWEWTKFYAETVTTEERGIRESLRALVEPNISRYRVIHGTGAALSKYVNNAIEAGIFNIPRSSSSPRPSSRRRK